MPFPGPPPILAQTTLSRPSTANSSLRSYSTSDSRSTLVTSPSLSSIDGHSIVSELSFGSAAANRRPNPRLRRAFDMQAAFAQDNLLFKLKLNMLSTDPLRPRRMSHILFSALPAELLPILSRTLSLSPAMVARLQAFQLMLWQTRDAERGSSCAVACQVALRDALYRIYEAAKTEPHKLPRRPYENFAFSGESQRLDAAMRLQTEMLAKERLENDLARFLYEAIDLRDVLLHHGHQVTTEIRDRLRTSSRALPAKEMERILQALNLDTAQSNDVRRYVEQCAQVESVLRPMASSDSMTPSEPGRPGSL